jgi:hypothetical protein
VCQSCIDQGITLDAVKALQVQSDLTAAKQLRPEKLRPSELKDRALDGRMLKKQFAKPGAPNLTQWYLGMVHFRGRQPEGNLLVVYEDGDAEITTRWQLARDQVIWEPEGTPIPSNVSFKNPATAESSIRNRTALTARQQPALVRNPRNPENTVGPKTQANRRSMRLASRPTVVASTAMSTSNAACSSLPTDSVLTVATNFPLVGVVSVGSLLLHKLTSSAW